MLMIFLAGVSATLLSSGRDRPPPTPVPQEIEGTCRASGIGRAFLEQSRAQQLPVPQCDRAVSIGPASLSFFKTGDADAQIIFSGSLGRPTGFEVELIAIGNQPARETISGRCLRTEPRFIMCRAIFEEDGVRKGIALSFDLPPVGVR